LKFKNKETKEILTEEEKKEIDEGKFYL